MTCVQITAPDDEGKRNDLLACLNSIEQKVREAEYHESMVDLTFGRVARDAILTWCTASYGAPNWDPVARQWCQETEHRPC